MLARVAERIYWLARYVERAENTARLLDVYSNLLLDLPRGTRLGWESLIEIVGAKESFYTHFKLANEWNVTRFVLFDPRNSGSIRSSLVAARENARTTREVLPREAWENLNELYLKVEECRGQRLARVAQAELVGSVVDQLRLLSGILRGSMSRTQAWDFLMLGRFLERADMTTRIVDVGTGSLFSVKSAGALETSTEAEEGSLLWMSVLNSLSAYQMYRQYSHDRVAGPVVVSFLLKDERFPRSVAYCLMEIGSGLAKLPRGETARKELQQLRRSLADTATAGMAKAELHRLIDDLQIEFAKISENIASTWFHPAQHQIAADTRFDA